MSQSSNNLARRFDLNDSEALWVQTYAEAGDDKAACLAIGYAADQSRKILARFMRAPQVVAALHLEVLRLLQQDAPRARRTALSLMENEEVSAKVRADIAFKLLDRAGFIAPRAAPAGRGGDTPMHEMTTTELRSLANRLEGEIAGRAKEVGNVPADPIDDAQAAALLD